MKLTKKARVFLKEADKVAPLLSKECNVCKHHNPNHLLLINEEAGYKIICKQCNSPKETKLEEIKAEVDSVIDTSVKMSDYNDIEIKMAVGKLKVEKTKKLVKAKKEKTIRTKKKAKTWPDKFSYMETEEWGETWENDSTLYSTDNSIISNKPVTQWNLAYGEPPKGFKGQIWLAESPDPTPIKKGVNELGIEIEIYKFG